MTFRQFVWSALFGVRTPGGGWASHSLIDSVRRVVLRIAAALAAIMAAAGLFTLGPTVPGTALAAAYLSLLAYALVSARRPVAVVPLLIAMYVLGAVGYVVSGDIASPLTFAACWLINAAGCATGLLVHHRGSYAVAALGVVGVPAVILLVLPGWGSIFPFAVLVTQLSILVVVRLGISVLLDVGRRADDDTAAAERAIRDVEVVHSASRRLAEDARVLHDTAINTLGAIANGGVGVADADQVRAQAAHDVIRLETLRMSSPDSPASLDELFAPARLPVERAGLDDEELRGLQERLPPAAIRGLVGCVREALTNAAKHSGADHAELRTVVEGSWLEVTVSDAGVGFDGGVDGGRGLAESVFARAEAAGIEARLATAPGEGTTIRLRAPLLDGGSAAPQAGIVPPIDRVVGDVGATVEQFRRRAGSLWGAGVTVVSIVLTLAGGTDHDLALYPMIAVMALCWGVTAAVQRRRDPGRRLPAAVLALLLLGAPVVFVLSAVAVRFGADGAVNWQALAATGPLVLLVSSRPPRPVVAAAFAVWIAVIVALAAVLLPRDASTAVILVIAGCVGVGLSFGWIRFQDAIARIGEHAAAAQHREFAARLAAETETAAQETFRRWLDAGLDPAIGLLRRIADGAVSPADPAIRRDSDREEVYLRQLILVSPELIHLGRAVMPALAVAREREVRLALRLGERDAPDEATARRISRLLQDAIAGVERDGSLTATVFPVREGLQLTLIAPHPALAAVAQETAQGVAVRYEQLGDLDLLELGLLEPAA